LIDVIQRHEVDVNGYYRRFIVISEMPLIALC